MGDLMIADARPPHIVQINRTFLIGVTEVTQAEYLLVAGDNPSHFLGAKRPVDSVTWDETVAFCEKLSARPGEVNAGRLYRLPTEAEWEYACRAGTKTNFGTGQKLPPEMANTRRSGWQATTDVGIFPPGPLGLFDMHGNVSEWCSDWYGSQYYAAALPIDPLGPRDGLNRVTRGGSWDSDPADCRCGSRGSWPPNKRSPTVGFRVVCIERSN
jgi:formylglycine-generating enzyme required for sulfatase activity